MSFSYSNIVTVAYFSLYTLFLFILGYIVYKAGGHESIKSKSYIKDLWAQRKIYAPLLVYFYDTASDIGVLIFWYQLMMNEQNEIKDYNSVDMALFFWLGISFLLLFRLIMVIATIVAYYSDDDFYDWYDAILVIFDVYVFKTVYISFNHARTIISKNAEKRKQKQTTQQKTATEIQMQIEMASQNVQSTTDLNNSHDTDVEEIVPSDPQQLAQIVESVFEAMPQIILQSIFVIRSANDNELQRASSNDILVMLSITASLISISNKFIATLDTVAVEDIAVSLKPRAQCPACVQYWYIIRSLWRIFDIMSRFVVYVLIWAVIGGAWLPIWFGLVSIVWILIGRFVMGNSVVESVVYAFVCAVGTSLDKDIMINVFAYIQTAVGLTIITIFTLMEFDCWNCSDAKERQMTNNNRVMVFVIMGWSSLFGQIILYAMMRLKEILIERP
eukprot:334226_1